MLEKLVIGSAEDVFLREWRDNDPWVVRGKCPVEPQEVRVTTEADRLNRATGRLSSSSSSRLGSLDDSSGASSTNTLEDRGSHPRPRASPPRVEILRMYSQNHRQDRDDRVEISRRLTRGTRGALLGNERRRMPRILLKTGVVQGRWLAREMLLPE